jgi:Sec-independent protein translocase protein TatA
VGLSTEILFIVMLGLLVLGPKQMHTLLGHVARANAQFERRVAASSLSSRRNSTLGI